MASDSHHDDHHKRLARLPIIPDLRFEYSYLRSIQQFIHLRRASSPQTSPNEVPDELLYEKSEGKGKGREIQIDLSQPLTTASSSKSAVEVLEIEWSSVAWVTLRDQVISPLLQGALWATASYFLTPYSARIGQTLTSHLPSREGNGVGWLRRWVKSLGLSGSGWSMGSPPEASR